MAERDLEIPERYTRPFDEGATPFGQIAQMARKELATRDALQEAFRNAPPLTPGSSVLQKNLHVIYGSCQEG